MSLHFDLFMLLSQRTCRASFATVQRQCIAAKMIMHAEWLLFMLAWFILIQERTVHSDGEVVRISQCVYLLYGGVMVNLIAQITVMKCRDVVCMD